MEVGGVSATIASLFPAQVFPAFRDNSVQKSARHSTVENI